MRSELTTKTRSLAGSSDLTLLAPIKSGLVPSLESVTYKTRVKRLLATLNAGRTSSHEYSLLRPFADAVERTGKIHSVRVAIVEPDRLLLSVTFDGGHESYLRVLWQKVGILLDVIFCNTEGYVTAWDHTFEEWANWVRQVQIETDFFYGMPGLTVDDVQYLRKQEFVYRRKPGGIPTDLEATREAVRSAEEASWSQVNPPRIDVTKDLGRQGIRALVLVFRLTAYYVPGTTDGDLLHRATRELLQEFIRLARRHDLDPVIAEGRKRFDEQITWLLRPFRGRNIPPLPTVKPQPDDRNDVQGGIISSYPKEITHGCLLLVAFRNRLGAAAFLEALTDDWVTREGTPPDRGKPYVNIHLTYEGLRAIGLAEAQLGLFPQEFREGMEARASVLGDLRTNHPRRWKLPVRNCHPRAGEPAPKDSLGVELSTVHAVVQMRIAGKDMSFGDTLDKGDPLYEVVAHLQDQHKDVEFLSVQPMVRLLNKDRKPIEHFGFVDGKSQPVLDPADNGETYNRNQVQLGEFLIGYANEADLPKDPEMAPDPDLAREYLGLEHNGSFLVVRKLSQDVQALEDALRHADTGLEDEFVLAKMMGRWRNGDALAARPGKGNDFDYASEDPPGSLCPFHAHIRRANPRTLDNPDLPPLPGRRTPRLMRRGMPYGPLYDPRDPDSGKESRGLMFMAYNASIAEQFEVVQRWISGGNSSAGFSGQSDPFLGVPPIGQRKWFRFEHKDKVYQIALDGTESLLGDLRPFVRLEWGVYLFTPSIKALQKLAQTAQGHADTREEPVWSVDEGWQRIQELLALENEHGTEKARAAWKALLEDPEAQKNFRSAGAWAAIRSRCGGVLRTPYGVIVADRTLVDQVLDNEGGLCSVSGYHERMLRSIGEIFLGLDDHGAGCPYREQSDAVNRAIGGLGKGETFRIAHDAARAAIDALVKNEKELAQQVGEPRWELNLDVKEVVDSALEALCQEWFGLPKEKCEIEPGGARWDWKSGDPVRYPGHFTAPSRYFFQPWPGESVAEYGIRYGEALRQKFAALVKRHRDQPRKAPVLDATKVLTRVILAAFPRRGTEGDPERDDLAGRTMAGAMMGFLPTLDGNLRLSLNEWLRDGSFWSLRGDLQGMGSAAEFDNAVALLEPPLREAMQLRPSPELIWRIATRDGRIGAVPVRSGDKIVIAIVSATQQCLEMSWPGDQANVYPVFGGNRRRTLHPTHACPGYEAAMGALLGVVSALLKVKESMRPSLAPLALTLEGDVPPVAPPAPEAAPEVREAPRPGDAPQARAPEVPVAQTARRGPPGASGASAKAFPPGVGRGHVLVADGDSWLSYFPLDHPLKGAQNIAAYLASDPYNFTVEKLANMGTRLYDFYDDGGPNRPLRFDKAKASSWRLNKLVTKVKRMVADGNTPAAILFSAAGNDVVENRLTPLLKDAGNPPKPDDALIEELVRKQVDELMKTWLEAILDQLNRECVTNQSAPIPVFIHGYDFPVPDARWLFGVAAPERSWLYPSFNEKGYENATNPHYPTNGVVVMKTLIKRLNDMQAGVAGLAKFKGHVFQVKLTETLSNQRGRYANDWDNELHPSISGFTALTKTFAEALVESIPALKPHP